MTQRNQRYSYLDAIFFSLMVALSESYLPAYLMAEGAGKFSAGLIQVIPLFLASISSALLIKFLLRRVHFPKSMILVFAFIQLISVICLGLVSHFLTKQIELIFALTSLYWFAALTAGPFWNIWADRVFDEANRSQFLSVRAFVSQISLAAGLIFGSYLLNARLQWPLFSGFTLLFSLAAVARLLSLYFLSRIDNVTISYPKPFEGQLTQLSAKSVFMFLLVYFTAVFTAAPYFSPYMLEVLKLDYPSYGWLMASSIIGKILGVAVTPLLTKRVKYNTLLLGCLLSIAVTPALWSFTQNFFFLVQLQLFGGFMWAVFELTFLLWMFETNDPHKKRILLIWFSFFNAFGMVLGCLIAYPLFWLVESYENLFLTSTGLRLLALFLFPYAFFDKTFSWRTLPMFTLGFRAGGFSLSRPFTKP